MPRIRYTDGPDELAVAPAGKPGFVAQRGEWVDVDDTDTVKSLVDQGWEKETAKKAASSRTSSEKE